MGRKKSTPTDRIDGHALVPLEASDPPSMLSRETQDGYTNLLTGIGDFTRDKTYGGQMSGPDFLPRFLTGAQCENRWRGSDLGGRVVETLPNEMTREWIDISIQPDDASDNDPKALTPEREALERADLFGANRLTVVVKAS